MNPFYNSEAYAELQKKYLDGQKLTFSEKKTIFQKAVNDAYDVDGGSKTGNSEDRLIAAIEKLENLKPNSGTKTKRKDNVYNAGNVSKLAAAENTIDYEKELRRQVQNSYKLASLAPPPESDRVDFINRNSQILNNCVAMMEALPENSLQQFQKTMGVTKSQLEEAIVKYDLKKEPVVMELAAVPETVKLPIARPVRRPSARLKPLAVSFAKPIAMPELKAEPIMELKSVATPKAEVKPVPTAVIATTVPSTALRSMFTRLMRTFGFGSTL